MSRHDTYVLPSARGFYLPRWMAALAGGGLMLWFGWGMMREPDWVVQRLESPAGGQTAFLKRVMYISQFYQIEIKRGFASERIFRSPALELDYKKDARERLLWSVDGKRLYFTLHGRMAWGWDAVARRELSAEELMKAEGVEKERICR